MERNLPATRESSDHDAIEQTPLPASRPLTVAFLPLALVTFVLLALIIAAWTFLAAAT